METSPGVLCRIQVKTASIDKHGNLNVSYGKKPYSKDEVDVIAVYDQTHDDVYYVPIERLERKGVLYSLRLTERRIKRKKGAALMAHDFRDFKIAR